jgi:hypothetical protein
MKIKLILFIMNYSMIYNQLPHIRVAQHTSMPKVPQIISVICKYGLQDKIGVSRLH